MSFKRTRQPAQYARIDPRHQFDFAWCATIGVLTGQGINWSGTGGAPSTPARLTARDGIGYTNCYSIVSRPVLSMHRTIWTEVGSVLLDGTNAVTVFSARGVSQPVRFVPASSLVSLVMWGVADVDISAGTLPVGVVNYVVLRNGSSHTVWLNGKLYGTASSGSSPSASDGTLPSVGSQAGSGGNQGGGKLVATTAVMMVARTPLALPPALCAQLSANPWQIFMPDQRSVWVEDAGGVQSITITPTGGIVFGGVAPAIRALIKAASGGIALAGTASAQRGIVRTPTGGVVLSGTSPSLRGAVRTPTGGAVFGGTAPATFQNVVQSLTVTPTGGFTFGGAATIVRSAIASVSGGIVFGGAAAVEYVYIGLAGLSDWIGYIRRRGRR